jgi:hypothetical protein
MDLELADGTVLMLCLLPIAVCREPQHDAHPPEGEDPKWTLGSGGRHCPLLVNVPDSRKRPHWRMTRRLGGDIFYTGPRRFIVRLGGKQS